MAVIIFIGRVFLVVDLPFYLGVYVYIGRPFLAVGFLFSAGRYIQCPFVFFVGFSAFTFWAFIKCSEQIPPWVFLFITCWASPIPWPLFILWLGDSMLTWAGIDRDTYLSML